MQVLQTLPALAPRHVSPEEEVTYNSEPPTSGPHDPQPVIWGAYDEPVATRQAVHNLEHGGIVVNFGRDVPASEPGSTAALSGFRPTLR